MLHHRLFSDGAKDLDRCKLCLHGQTKRSLVKFLELLQQEQAEQYGSAQLIVVGSCGLRTLHNTCKVLRAMHTIFHNTPARKEDFTVLTKTKQFSLPFCSHRWLENLSAVERALEVWPSVTMFVNAVRTKRLPNPGTSSFDTLETAQKDLSSWQNFTSTCLSSEPSVPSWTHIRQMCQWCHSLWTI